MDASKLNGFKASATRARETILSHNQILWDNKEGGIAREGEDLPNLNVEDVNTGVSNTVEGSEIVSVGVDLVADRSCSFESSLHHAGGR